MDTFRTINLCEGILWLAVSAGFLVALVRRGDRGAKLIAALTFAAFGLSDFVEMDTGAWWRPWWLLMWKGLCVAVMLTQLGVYMRRQRAIRRRTEGESSE